MELRQRYYRKVIRIRAEDSPNVRYALNELAQGKPVSHTIVVPGVLTYDELLKRRRTWDKIRQTIGLDAEFPKDARLFLFPPNILSFSEAFAEELLKPELYKSRKAKGLGCDPAEGGDKTSICIVDEYGVLDLISLKTPDTSKIPKMVLDAMREWGLKPSQVNFDRGGGGKQHADVLRSQGFAVHTTGFGEAMTPDPKHGITTVRKRKEQKEEKYTYKNRRVEMYDDLAKLCDPLLNQRGGFGILSARHGEQYGELRTELAPLPRQYDDEGRMWLPPKQKKNATDERETLTEIIGHSPDEADALVLAVNIMIHPGDKRKAGVAD